MLIPLFFYLRVLLIQNRWCSILGNNIKYYPHNYPDHHQFSLKNIAKLAGEFSACKSQKKVIITTEKDAQRLGVHELLPAIAQLPVWVLPIGVNFLNNGQQEFDKLVTNYVREYTKHN
jgi:tetraacyldisaccharide 4'-kinase